MESLATMGWVQIVIMVLPYVLPLILIFLTLIACLILVIRGKMSVEEMLMKVLGATEKVSLGNGTAQDIKDFLKDDVRDSGINEAAEAIDIKKPTAKRWAKVLQRIKKRSNK